MNFWRVCDIILYNLNDLIIQKSAYEGGDFLEYAIIKANGKKVSANETSERGLVYICPYCGEECLTLNIGYKSSWFSHPKKVDRTPLEKTCPEYKEADKVIDDVSRLYIKNGGVPVYLHKNESRFYIDAIFPQLSLQSLELLKGAKIKVDKQLYNVTNRSGIIYHRLDNINTKWINVSIADNRKTNPEIKQKWLCGIMGLNKLEQSIFQCNANGGYRISHNNHVFVGQKYYIISGSQNIGKVPGIEYTRQGSISLYHNNFGQSKSYYVYIMRIISATRAAKDEIRKRQYILCEKESMSYPMWPPCNILGNQLVYNDKVAFFFLKSSKNEYFSYHSSTGYLCKINSKDHYRIIYPEHWKCIYTAYDVYDTIKGEKVNIPIENIQWYIAYQKAEQSAEQFKHYFELANDSNEIISDGNIEWKSVCDFKIKSNIPVKAIVKIGEFVVGCYTNKVEGLQLGMTIILDAGSYGQKKYYIVKSQKNSKHDYSALLQMKGINTKTDSVVKKFYTQIKDDSPIVAKQVKKWISSGLIPVAAQKYIYNEMRK